MSTRPEHVLKATRDNNRPTRIIFFDSETSTVPLPGGEKRLILRLGVAWHVRSARGKRLTVQKEVVFTTSSELWDFVNQACPKRTTTYLTAHNLGFDLAVTDGFKGLYDRGWTLESFYSKGVTSIFRWSRDDCKLIGVDNTNLFPGKLERWGTILLIPKLKINFDTAVDSDLIPYCRRDVEIMYRCWLTWLEFLDANGCGAFKSTVGATAFSTWRHSYMPTRVHIHNNTLALSLERSAYRGGRTEVLFQGSPPGDKFYYLDVNSLYGCVLSRYYYPAGLYTARETDSLSLLLKKLEKYTVIARVEIETSQPWFPLKYQAHTCYPIGRFITTLTTPELILCFQRGWLRSVQAIAWYRQASLFSAYVKAFIELRRQYRSEGNAGFSEICKLLINSLYGKFGQQAFEQTLIGETDISNIWRMSCYDADSGEFYDQIALAGGVYEERKTGEAFHSFPAIAAHVTAYARLYLYRLCQKVPTGHVFYMDTDSLIVDGVGLDALKTMLHPERIGYLKIEHESNDLTIYAPKDYKMGERQRIKGIRQGAVRINDSEFLQDQWFGLAGLIRRGNVDGAIIRPLRKHQQRAIFSGRLLPSGWVEPFLLSPLEVAPVEFQPQLLELH